MKNKFKICKFFYDESINDIKDSEYNDNGKYNYNESNYDEDYYNYNRYYNYEYYFSYYDDEYVIVFIKEIMEEEDS